MKGHNGKPVSRKYILFTKIVIKYNEFRLNKYYSKIILYYYVRVNCILKTHIRMYSSIPNLILYDNHVILVRFISDFRDQDADTCTRVHVLSVNDIINDRFYYYYY